MDCKAPNLPYICSKSVFLTRGGCSKTDLLGSLTKAFDDLSWSIAMLLLSRLRSVTSLWTDYLFSWLTWWLDCSKFLESMWLNWRLDRLTKLLSLTSFIYYATVLFFIFQRWLIVFKSLEKFISCRAEPASVAYLPESCPLYKIGALIYFLTLTEKFDWDWLSIKVFETNCWTEGSSCRGESVFCRLFVGLCEFVSLTPALSV